MAESAPVKLAEEGRDASCAGARSEHPELPERLLPQRSGLVEPVVDVREAAGGDERGGIARCISLGSHFADRNEGPVEGVAGCGAVTGGRILLPTATTTKGTP